MYGNGNGHPAASAAPETWSAALWAILEGPAAWTLATELEAAGHGPALEGLARVGLTTRWQLPPGPAWTLTPWGAWMLGVDLVEVGDDETPRWRPSHYPVRPIRIPRHPGTVPLGRPELIPDRGPGPDLLLDEGGEPVLLFGRPVPLTLPSVATLAAALRPKRRRKAPGKNGKAAKVR